MKICYVSNNFEIHDYRFLQKMVENNYEVHAISLRKDRINDKFIIKGIQYYEFYKNRKIYQKRFHGLNPFWFISAYIFVKKIIKEVEPDILHGGYANISGFISAVVGFHPFLLMPWGSDILSDPINNIFINKLVKYAVTHADMITCDAETVKKRIVENYEYNPDKIIVFPWGIDLNKFNPNNNEVPVDLLEWNEKIVVICTRQHKEVYGIEYLINAIPKIIKENENIRFIFIGDGHLTEKYKLQLNKDRMNQYVKFTGRIDNNQLPQYLTNSSIYVSPSLSDGSSLSLMEALACSLPVIVTNIDANLEWVKDYHNGIIVSPKNTENLVNSIIKLSHDKSLCSKMAIINLQIANEKANWDTNFKKLEEIYCNLLMNNKQ